MRQKNGNTPVSLKVREKPAAGARLPLSQAPVADVVVCVAPPLFVQVTLAPCFTVTWDGENWKLTMLMPACALAGSIRGSVRAMTITATASAPRVNIRRFCVFIAPLHC